MLKYVIQAQKGRIRDGRLKPEHWHNIATAMELLSDHLEDVRFFASFTKDVINNKDAILGADFTRADVSRLIQFGSNHGMILSERLVRSQMDLPYRERVIRLGHVEKHGLKAGADFLIRCARKKAEFEQARLLRGDDSYFMKAQSSGADCPDPGNEAQAAYQMQTLGGFMGVISMIWGAMLLPGVMPATVICPLRVGAAIGFGIVGAVIVIIANPPPAIQCWNDPITGNLKCG